MNPAIRYEEPGGAASAVLAVLVHVILIAFLVVGVRWQASRPEAVVVELWNEPPVEEQRAPAPPKVEPQPEPKPEPKIEPKPQPKVEPKPAKPDIALEREKKTPKKEPPKKAPPKKEPPLKLDPRERINEELAREMEALKKPADRPAPPRPAAGPVLDAGYIAKISSRIRSNIVLPQNVEGNPEAGFTILQLPTGEVLSVTLTKSSGNKLLDDAIERAIRKSSPLPRPDRPDQFQREIRITYRPLD